MEVDCSEGEEEPDKKRAKQIDNQEELTIVDSRDDREAESADESADSGKGQSCVSDREETSLRSNNASLHANLNSEKPKEVISSGEDQPRKNSSRRGVNVMSEGRHYLHSRVVAEMVKWYLGSGVAAGAGAGRIVVEGTNEACPSLPAFSAPSSPLLLLIGAGGMLYMMRRGLQEEEEERREEGEGLWSWIKWFTEKQNPPPALPAPRLAPKDLPLPLPSVPSSEDRSLNSLTSPCSPRKLLTRPLYVANPRARHVLTRTTLPTTRPFKRQARAERRQGDGMELADCGNEEKLSRAVEEELVKSAKLRPSSALFMCRGEPDGQDQWSRASSVCRSRASSLGKDMGEVVRQAREVRRLIREASVDSQASDLCLNPPSDLCLVEYDGPWSSPNLPGSPEEPVCWESEVEEDSGLRQWEGDCRAAWRLTGPGSFVSEDWASEAGSLDPWEWDEEGWLEDNSGEADEQVSNSQLLPNLCAELDLESELWFGNNLSSRPNSAASTASDDVTISASPL